MVFIRVCIDCLIFSRYCFQPFYNGKKHQITGSLHGPDKKEFCKIDGEWNGVMYAKYSDTKVSDIFFDTKTTPVIKKNVRPIAEQGEFESRRYE